MEGMEEKLVILWERMLQVGGEWLPKLGLALVILLGGWIVAKVVAAGVRGALRRTTIDNRIAGWLTGAKGGEEIEIEKWTGKIVYFLIMLFVLVATFQTLGLTVVTEPLNRLLTEIFGFAPRILSAGALLLAAWILATLLKGVVTRVLGVAKIDERLGAQAEVEGDGIALASSLGDAVYWLVFLLFLPAILGALAIHGLLAPVQAMLDKLLVFLPNIFAAVAIAAIGWFVARMVKRIVTNLLAAVGVDRLGDRVGLSQAAGGQRLSGILGLVVYALILIPVLISSLNALKLEAITQPASNMLNSILAAIPVIFAAALILSLAYVVGRLVASLITNVLTGIGFNALMARMGFGAKPGEGTRTPASLVGTLVMISIMLLAAMEASRMIGFGALSNLVSQFTVFGSQILLGLVIFGVGLYLAQLAAAGIKASGMSQAGMLAMVARVSIIVLTGAMALGQMGLANEIINLAFGLMLGSIAVAAALAFGLGGRELAGEHLKQWFESMAASTATTKKKK